MVLVAVVVGAGVVLVAVVVGAGVVLVVAVVVVVGHRHTPLVVVLVVTDVVVVVVPPVVPVEVVVVVDVTIGSQKPVQQSPSCPIPHGKRSHNA